MKILITNHRLSERGGSELFVAEVAIQLAALGHKVCVFSALAGPVSLQIENAGISFVTDPALCPFRPDIIHGQHHMEAMTALLAWPGVPALYFVHGSTPWEEQPPMHPSILRYLGTSPRFAEWIARITSVAPESVGTVENFYNPKRFPRMPSGMRTRKALIFHNAIVPGSSEHAALEAGCAAAGYPLETVGAAAGRTVEDPAPLLREFEVVFAGGRSAIEAMVCGCAVIPLTKSTLGPLIRESNFEALSAINFCAELNDPPFAADVVASRLHEIDPLETARLSERVREQFTLSTAVNKLVQHYRDVVCDFVSHQAAIAGRSPEADLRMASRYLLGLATSVKDVDDRRAALLERCEAAISQAERSDRRAAVAEEHREKATARAAKWKSRALRSEERLSAVDAVLSANWWTRRLWRRIRRSWSL